MKIDRYGNTTFGYNAYLVVSTAGRTAPVRPFSKKSARVISEIRTQEEIIKTNIRGYSMDWTEATKLVRSARVELEKLYDQFVELGKQREHRLACKASLKKLQNKNCALAAHIKRAKKKIGWDNILSENSPLTEEDKHQLRLYSYSWN